MSETELLKFVKSLQHRVEFLERQRKADYAKLIAYAIYPNQNSKMAREIHGALNNTELYDDFISGDIFRYGVQFCKDRFEKKPQENQ